MIRRHDTAIVYNNLTEIELANVKIFHYTEPTYEKFLTAEGDEIIDTRGEKFYPIQKLNSSWAAVRPMVYHNGIWEYCGFKNEDTFTSFLTLDEGQLICSDGEAFYVKDTHVTKIHWEQFIDANGEDVIDDDGQNVYIKVIEKGG